MRVLLSTIGSRGDVQPLVALASRLRDLGQEVLFCVPPDFRDWIGGFGFPMVPVGPEVRGKSGPVRPGTSSPEQRRQLMADTVATQFAALTEAAKGCDLVLGFAALQFAAHSVAEAMGIPHVHATFCPITLPSPHHAPPVVPVWPHDEKADNDARWALDARRWNDDWRDALNEQRAALGLDPVSDVLGHIITDRPWLAADPVLAPWPEPSDRTVFQTGAWFLPDDRPLSTEVEEFLDAGEPPVFFGFGSMAAPEGVSHEMVRAARALGRRAIISRGWADLSLADEGPDCLCVGEVNVQALFRRVAAVVHHGGSGTTTIATAAGAPQVVVPQWYDQHYWARRCEELGIGSAHAPGAPTAGSLVTALNQVLQPDVAARARSIAAAVRTDGVMVAAQRLVAMAS
ncbi:glycosyltransferase [Streptoalloteichus hindustanus]|uniref:Vancomycin aglycone glucosyltransferase n=1 Tax=Streptoalloteichus hindustanus TaxID=2017 RepID=A0A1M5I5V7_STRHI|nr:glycosyltransferase [Streptoalloteichus hindustanus]SHG23577.1 vancomycin aglycone glucosyltransferase [Streptoalloteichus hindustanus]